MQLTSKPCSGRRCCLAISAAQKLPNCHLGQKNSTRPSSRDELHCSNKGLNCRERLMSHDWSSCDHCSHLWLGLGYRTCIACSFAHSYLDHTLSGLTADSLAVVPKCHHCRMDTVEPVSKCRNISDPISMVPKCLGSEVSRVRSVCTPPGLATPYSVRS